MTMWSALNCAECFMRDGNPGRPADFIVNGQSVCQKHVHVVIRERGQGQMAYTWGAPEGEPLMEEIRL